MIALSFKSEWVLGFSSLCPGYFKRDVWCLFSEIISLIMWFWLILQLPWFTVATQWRLTTYNYTNIWSKTRIISCHFNITHLSWSTIKFQRSFIQFFDFLGHPDPTKARLGHQNFCKFGKKEVLKIKNAIKFVFLNTSSAFCLGLVMGH